MTTTTRPMARRRALVAVALASTLVLASACGEDDETTDTSAATTQPGATTEGTEPTATPTGLPQATYVTGDYTIEGPSELSAGLVEITQQNAGGEDHHVQFAKLNDGVTYEQLDEALAQPDPTAAMVLVTLAGGPNGATPNGGEQSVVLSLDAGDYILLCLIPSPDGIPHLAKGMTMPLTVTESDAEVAPAPPSSLGTFTLKDMAVELPDGFDGAPGWYSVVNAGPQPHEMVAMLLDEGKTAEDLAAWAATEEGAPPAKAVGGTAVLAPETSMWVYLDLAAGDYLFTCYFPDLTDPTMAPHIAKGMVTPYTQS
jgi:hypothetical protein